MKLAQLVRAEFGTNAAILSASPSGADRSSHRLASMKQDEPPQDRAQPWIIGAEARAAKTEARVAAQVAWLAELRHLGHDTTEATAALIALTNQLMHCYAELGFEQAGGIGWQQVRQPPSDSGGAAWGSDDPTDQDSA